MTITEVVSIIYIMNDAIRNFLNMNVDYEDTCDYDDGEHIGYIKNYDYEFLASCTRLVVNILNDLCGQGKWGMDPTTNNFNFVPLSPYPWTSRQYAAIVRAKYDRPIVGVRRLLDSCTISSIEKNRDHLVRYFLTCYDWMDLSVALYIYGTLVKPDRAKNLQIATTTTKKSKQPMICFSEETSLEDMQWYLSQNWKYIKTAHVKPEKTRASQITIFTIRNVILNYLATQTAKKLSANELLGVLEYCFKIDRLPFLTDGYTDLEVWKDRSKFKKQWERDWFHNALLQFNEEMKTDVLEVLYFGRSLNSTASFIEKEQKDPDYLSLLYKIPTVFNNDQKVQEFELSFKNQTFNITRV